MKVKKIFIALALTLVMTLGIFAMTGCDLFGGNNGNGDTNHIELQFERIDGAEAYRVAGSVAGSGAIAQIPNYHNGLPVTHIGNSAFDNRQITSVTIGNNVTHIGDLAFFRNQITTVTIPNSVNRIGAGAFNQSGLTSVTLGSSVEFIGSHAFILNQLTFIVIPDSVTHIGTGAFQQNQLTSVVIHGGDTITHISVPFRANQLASFIIYGFSNLAEADEAFRGIDWRSGGPAGILFDENIFEFRP